MITVGMGVLFFALTLETEDCQFDVGIAVVFKTQHLVDHNFLAHKQGVDTQQ
jgi:hypothetical protein